jgi:hypothetical protein
MTALEREIFKDPLGDEGRDVRRIRQLGDNQLKVQPAVWMSGLPRSSCGGFEHSAPGAGHMLKRLEQVVS